MTWQTYLALGVCALALVYTGVIWWYTLGIAAWRNHILYAPEAWRAPARGTGRGNA